MGIFRAHAICDCGCSIVRHRRVLSVEATDAGVGVNRTFYVVLWVFEVLAIIAMVLAMVLPIQDYALREFIEWREHPSSETYQLYIEKQRQERAVRFIIAIPFGVTAVVLTAPLKKYRQKLRSLSNYASR